MKGVRALFSRKHDAAEPRREEPRREYDGFQSAYEAVRDGKIRKVNIETFADEIRESIRKGM